MFSHHRYFEIFLRSVFHIGDTVNTTQRIESLTRQLFTGNGVVIGYTTYLALAEYTADFNLEPAGMHEIKGKSDQLLVYRLRLSKKQTDGVPL